MIKGLSNSQVPFDLKTYGHFKDIDLKDIIKYQVHPLDLKSPTDTTIVHRNQVPRQHIAILTQNMFMLPGLPEGKVKLHKDDRMKEFVRTVLPQFDVVCC